MSVPITFIIDDPAPLINVYYWQVKNRSSGGEPLQNSGEPIVRDVPLDFLEELIAVVERHGIRGKFSVIPVPAGLGRISAGWKGCDERALARWITLVRDHIAPAMDITPEMNTHAATLDVETFRLLEENERDWASHQTEATLTPYISAALRFLNEVDLPATGVTSPWDFGIEVEGEYRAAIRNAMRSVNNNNRSWYFLHTEPDSLDRCSKVVARDADGWLVSISSQCRDFLWDTMEVEDSSPGYIASLADRYLTEDGKSGRLVELFSAGVPIVFHSHWQSLFSNGRRTGLAALREVGRRVGTLWGSGARWVSCREFAFEIAGSDTDSSA